MKRRLRVAFFSTGDELRLDRHAARAGQVYDSNRYTLYGMLSRLGVEIIDMGVVRDDPQKLEAAFTRRRGQADAIITTGGVSVGEADFVKQLMAKLGEVLFWKIAMRPGRPMAFGRIGKRTLFGLPGNPVAVMVTFHQFVRECIARPGRTDGCIKCRCSRPSAQARFAKSPAHGIPARHRCMRKRHWKVRVTGQQGSGVLRSMSEANCFIVLEHERGKRRGGRTGERATAGALP